MLETLFRSRVMVKLLSYFLNNPGKEVYLREASREVSEPPSAVQRELERLEALGLLGSRRHGNHKYFKVRPEFPILPELRSLFLKTEGAVALLKESLAGLGGIQLAFVYGEFAERPAGGASEINLVIIGSPDRTKLDGATKNLRGKLGRVLNYTQYSPDEFKHLLEIKDPSLERALNGEKLVLVANVAEKD
ncbi:MAG: winged helix-turn-helix domain-containing protein [Candidatus Aquicultor sp.]